MLRIYVLLLLGLAAFNTHARTAPPDNLRGAAADSIIFNKEEAWNYIQDLTGDQSRWRAGNEALRIDLMRLLEHATEPYDSIRIRLSHIDLGSVPVSLTNYLQRDSVGIRWLNDSTFILDSVGWNRSLLLKKETLISIPEDLSTIISGGVETDTGSVVNGGTPVAFQPDTVIVAVIDTAAIEALGIRMFSYRNLQIDPPLDEPEARRSAHVSSDSLFLILTDTLSHWEADPSSPFRILNSRMQLDSLGYAVETLLDYNRERDSTKLVIRDINDRPSTLWLTSGSNESTRFWAKNFKNDSITLWLGNPAPLELSLMLEDEIQVDRMMKEDLAHLPVELAEPDRTLAEMSSLEPDATFWDYDLTSAFTLNQTYLANWTKGGESALSTLLDIMGIAIYNDKKANTEWINSIRMNIGTLLTPEKGLRKNNDLFEINSKFNRNASGKIGLSASLYFKSQLAKGYNYPNDSVIVSKFLNPASLTLGLGAEYKPFKNTSINVAPLSYKNTFVLDTALIDQTKHGIARDKRAKQELGTQVVILNKFTAIEDLAVTNRLRLFSNYIHKPQNIDVEWEMLLDRKINWFFTIRLNLHLIYDDDVRFTVMDAEGLPVLGPDGAEKQVPRAQFKEFVGLSLLFQF